MSERPPYSLRQNPSEMTATPGQPHPNADLQYIFFNQRPISITQYARPYLTREFPYLRIDPEVG